MFAATSSERISQRWAAADPVGEVINIQSIRPEIKRSNYQNPRGQNRSLFKKRSEKEQHKPSDPAHKVDDYA